MNTITDWPSLLDARQKAFVNPNLDKTLTYLRTARVPGEGWGPYPKLGSDLHHSSLAIQALSNAGDASFVGTIAGAASYFRSRNEGQLHELCIEDICDLLLLIRVEQRPEDDEYVQSLISLLLDACNHLLEKGRQPSVRTICSILLAALEWGDCSQSLACMLTERLIKMQNTDGSWPSAGGDSSSIVASAMAIRVLTRLEKTDDGGNTLRRGLIFLNSEIDRKTWSGIGIEGDTFSQAVVLRALAEAQSNEYKCIQDGIDILLSSMNMDGSWGGGAGEPGNVENTALSLLALVAAGENKFLPARLAKAAITDLQAQLGEVNRERDNLRQDFDRKIQDECGLVVQERNKLIKENKGLKDRTQTAEKDAKKSREALETTKLRMIQVERETQMVASDHHLTISPFSPSPAFYRHPSFYLRSFVAPIITANLLILASLAANLAIWEWPMSILRWLALVAISAIGLSGAFILWLRYRVAAREMVSLNLDQSLKRDMYVGGEEESNDLHYLRSMYLSMAETMPSSVREEMAYRLTEILSAPMDIGYRFGEELAFKLRLPSTKRREFTMWLGLVLRLSTTERRLLLGQLQRMTLR
jgi:hypothetical protein